MSNQDISEKKERAERLRSIRRGLPKNFSKKSGQLSKNLSLMSYFDPFIDWLYGIALSLAILKDILDLVVVGSLLGIGTVITFAVSASIFFIMLITGSLFQARWARRVGVLASGTLVEMIFGIDFLPFETAIVIIVFRMTLKSRKETAEKRAEQSSLSASEAPAMV